jgi:hypothetical protein
LRFALYQLLDIGGGLEHGYSFAHGPHAIRNGPGDVVSDGDDATEAMPGTLYLGHRRHGLGVDDPERELAVLHDMVPRTIVICDRRNPKGFGLQRVPSCQGKEQPEGRTPFHGASPL